MSYIHEANLILQIKTYFKLSKNKINMGIICLKLGTC